MIRTLFAVVAAGAALLVFSTTAFTAGNGVPTSSAASVVTPITPDALKPAACAGITVTTLVLGGNGTNADELILGTPGNDSITAKNGDDCILGGAGDDTINGGPGNDVCIGGPGNDTFSACETQIQ